MKTKQPDDITPGQLWVWMFSVGDGTWLVEKVNNTRRENSYYIGEHVILKRGDTFLVIATDDEGPLSSMTQVTYMRRPYYISLLHGKLVWMGSDLFESSQQIA